MDPIDESMDTQSLNQQHHNNQAFVNYRKNISNDEQQISQLNIDSAYGSGYNLITPNSTPNVSTTNLNEALTPQRNNNLNIIHENHNNDSVNLTPVTQNINRICSFHITTPKSQDFLNTNKINTNSNKKQLQQIFNIKRSSECLYDFDNFQSTPKKIKIRNDSNNQLLLNDKNTNSTPLKNKENTKNLKFRQKLHSASDLDGYFDENIFSPKKLNKTTSKLNNNRTPFINLLSNNNYNNKSENKSTTTSTPIVENTDSVKKLLSCSNEEFNILINTKNENDNNFNIINQSLEFNDYYTDTNFDDFKNCNNNFKKIHTYEPIKIETSAAKVPFRRFLSFANDTEFKTPNYTINNNNNSTTSSLSNSIESNRITSDDEYYLENSFPQYKKQYRILNTVCSDRLRAKQRANAARLADLENSFREDTNAPEKLKLTDNDNQIIGSSDMQIIDQNLNLLPNSKNKTENDSLSIICDKAKPIINDKCIQLTPPKRKLSLEDEFIPFASKDHEICNILPRTPKKLKTIQNNNNINYEKYEIIYPTIPTTPRKNSIQLSPKRKHNDRKIFKQNYNQYKKFYDGAIHLNIIAKLESYPIVLDRIFDYLTSYDLLNLSMATKIHRNIIKCNSKANRRLKKHLIDFQVCKENYGIKKLDYDKDIKKSHSEVICSQAQAGVKKMPFSQCNTKFDRKRSLDIVHSPPVSPSKKKFYENQKVVNLLSGNQSISKCPRCAKACRIINTTLEETIDNNNILKNTTLFSTISTEAFHVPSTTPYFVPKKPDDEQIKDAICCDIFRDNDTTLQNLSHPIKPLILHPRSRLIKSASVDTGLLQINTKRQQKIPFQPYGECMSKICSFKFCLNCTCEYHPNSKCKHTTSISPSKEDIENGILQLINSPHSKKAIAATRSSKLLRRKSLKRLCF